MKRSMMAAAGLAWGLAAVSGTASAGSISGTVGLGKASDAERTVVYLEAVPEGSFAPASDMVRLSQKGSNFNPPVLPIVRGSQVDMTNDDWVSHSVFSKSAPKVFDLGIYAQNERKVVSFDRLGPVEVFCAIHPRMNTVILVLQNPFFTKPGRDGSFTLDNVPAGTYKLLSFRPGAEPASVVVKVPASGNAEVRL